MDDQKSPATATEALELFLTNQEIHLSISRGFRTRLLLLLKKMKKMPEFQEDHAKLASICDKFRPEVDHKKIEMINFSIEQFLANEETFSERFSEKWSELFPFHKDICQHEFGEIIDVMDVGFEMNEALEHMMRTLVKTRYLTKNKIEEQLEIVMDNIATGIWPENKMRVAFYAASAFHEISDDFLVFREEFKAKLDNKIYSEDSLVDLVVGVFNERYSTTISEQYEETINFIQSISERVIFGGWSVEVKNDLIELFEETKLDSTIARKAYLILKSQLYKILNQQDKSVMQQSLALLYPLAKNPTSIQEINSIISKIKTLFDQPKA
jgi:hypothetical protein